MLDNLASSDIIILGILIGLILIVGITCIVLTIKGDGKKKKDNGKKKASEPEIQMSLATNLPDLDDDDDDKTKEIISEDVYYPKTKEETSSYEEVIKDDDEETLSNDLEMFEPEEQVVETEELIIDEDEPETISYTREKITEEKVDNSRTNISDVLKQMEDDIEKQKYEKIDRYEEEQEENAVISYQELLNRKMALNDEKEASVDEPKVERPNRHEEEHAYRWKDDEKQFSSSEFISPVFGRDNSNKEYKRVVEKEELKTTYTGSKDEALDETVDLLKALKEYRRNL